MRYFSGEILKLGDCVSDSGKKGIVVVIIDSKQALNPHDVSDWTHLKTGFLVDFDRDRLTYFKSDENTENLEFIQRAPDPKQYEKLLGCDIYCSKPLSEENVFSLLNTVMHALEFYHLDINRGTPANKENKLESKPNYFYFEHMEDSLRFPYKLVFETPEGVSNQLFIKLCLTASINFNMNCFCEYIDQKNSTDPYLSILYKKGKGYLVSDFYWGEADENGDDEKLEILSPFYLA